MDPARDLDDLIRASGDRNQTQFLSEMITLLSNDMWKSAQIEDPRNLYKSLAYLSSWLFFPRQTELLTALPDNISTLHGKLREDVSRLKPQCIEFYRHMLLAGSEYNPEFIDIFCQPWTISILLIDEEASQILLPVTPLNVLIPALLFNLTYIPSIRGKISTQLSEAVMTQEGVYTIIQCFAEGENKDVMRDMAVKVLSSVPKSVNSRKYCESVIGQCLTMLLQYKCDTYFKSIVADVTNNLLERQPDYCKEEFLRIMKRELYDTSQGVERAIQVLHVLTQKHPPSRLVLFLLEDDFPLLFTLETCIWKYPTLKLRQEVSEVLVQLCKYSDRSASLLFTAFISGYNLDYTFQLQDSTVTRSTEVSTSAEPAITNLEHNIEFLVQVSQDRLSVKVCSGLFSILLQEFSQSSSTIVLLYIASIAETLSPEMLVESGRQLQDFLRVALAQSDTEMWELALKLLISLLQQDLESLSKPFLMEVSKEIIELTHQENDTLVALANQANGLISKAVLLSEINSHVMDEEPVISAPLFSDLNSHQAFERAFALHQLSLLPPKQLRDSRLFAAIQPLLDDTDTFVFQNLLKLVLRMSQIDRRNTLTSILESYRSTSVVVAKSHVIELLFHFIISLGKVTIYTYAPEILQFLISGDETEELLVQGKLSVVAELAKYLGPALHPYLNYMIQMCLSCIRTGCSQIYMKRTPPCTLSPSLLILDKIMKYSPIDHLTSHLGEIRDVLELLDSLDSLEDVTKTLLTQTMTSAEAQWGKQFGLVNNP